MVMILHTLDPQTCQPERCNDTDLLGRRIYLRSIPEPDAPRATRPSGTLQSPKVSNIWDERWWYCTEEGFDDLS